MKSRYVLCCLAGLMAAHSVQAAPLVVGGFNTARGGEESIDSNNWGGGALQGMIAAQFPGATFTSTSALTPAYLSTNRRSHHRCGCKFL